MFLICSGGTAIGGCGGLLALPLRRHMAIIHHNAAMTRTPPTTEATMITVFLFLSSQLPSEFPPPPPPPEPVPDVDLRQTPSSHLFPLPPPQSVPSTKFCSIVTHVSPDPYRDEKHATWHVFSLQARVPLASGPMTVLHCRSRDVHCPEAQNVSRPE